MDIVAGRAGPCIITMIAKNKIIPPGSMGIVKYRDQSSAKVQWDNGNLYFHQIENISILKDVKDPNVLFCLEKRSRTIRGDNHNEI